MITKPNRVGTNDRDMLVDVSGFIWYRIDTMYIRTTRIKKKNGVAEYVQLAHNVRNPKTGKPQAQVLYHFGPKDQLDLDALRRLVRSISRFLEPEEAAPVQVKFGIDAPFEFLGAREIGGTALLDGLWKRLRIDRILDRLLTGRGYQTPVERLLFAMVANRALAPASKLAMEHWVANQVLIADLPAVEVHQLYRTMDFLLEAAEELQHDIFFSVANLLNLEVDLVFLDTTTTFFEIDGEDVDEEELAGLRKRGYSKDSHPELAQVVIGLAVTREGIPVRCWVWPGNTADQSVVDEVKRDLNGWQLGRVVWVADTGFNSAKNRRIFQGAGGHYILGEKLRPGSQGVPAEALSRGGKYQKLADGLEIKEVVVGGDSVVRRRYVVVRNPVEAEHDQKLRADIVREVERRLEALHTEEGESHSKAACALRGHRTYGRYVRQTRTGKLRLDKAKIREDALLDGKYLVSTSDDRLSAEDVVRGYKQLVAVERVFRDMKHALRLRPVYHRLPERIRAHVLLCWLAVLLIRIAENETGTTWHQIRTSLSTLQVGMHRTQAGEVWQTNPPTDTQKAIFSTLKLTPPPRYYSLPTPKPQHA